MDRIAQLFRHHRRHGPRAYVSTPPEPTVVEIPGEFLATYEDGRITGWVFMPSGSYAGYFGPPAILVRGDDELDIVETDGPFWRAVQEALGDVDPLGRIGVDWQE